MQRIYHAFSEARFYEAREVLADIRRQQPDDMAQLFLLVNELQINYYEGTRCDADKAAMGLELLKSRLEHHDNWPLHFYLLGWFTLPFVSERRIDAMYLYSRLGQVTRPANREECLLWAVYYAVVHRVHYFMALVEHDYPYGSDWLASTFHRNFIDALLAGHHREGETLAGKLDSLERAAGTPLQQLAVSKLRQHFTFMVYPSI
jgi:hypothetical protein